MTDTDTETIRCRYREYVIHRYGDNMRYRYRDYNIEVIGDTDIDTP